MEFNLNSLKELADAVAGGDVFDVADISALQKVGQLPADIKPEELLKTVTTAKDEIAAGDYSSLTTLLTSATEPKDSTSSDVSASAAATTTPDGGGLVESTSEDEILATSTVGGSISGSSSSDSPSIEEEEDVVVGSTSSDPVPTFKEVFGVGVSLSWDIPEVKFYDKLINKNHKALGNAKVKVGVVLDGSAENGTLEISFNSTLSDADLVDLFKVPIRFISLKEGYALFYVAADHQLIGEYVGKTLYLF